MEENRLVFEITAGEEPQPSPSGWPCRSSRFRRIIKDYFLVCETYYARDQDRAAVEDRGNRHGPARAA